MLDVSIVAPVYNEIESLEPLCQSLHQVMAAGSRSYEIILVDDGSEDGSWNKMVELSRKFPCLRLIRFRRNFGQTAAMSAGFHNARGEVVVTLDADLQNDPEDIPRLLDHMEQKGADVVSGWRKDRKDPFLSRRLPSMIANFMISRITGVALRDYGCTLKAYHREVIKSIQLYGQMHRFIPALASWAGSGIDEIVVKHHPRRHGKSKYGLNRTFRVVLDLITVKYLLRYSMGPMQIFGKIGGFFIVPGILLLVYMVATHLSFLLFDTSFAADLIKRPFWLTSSFMLIFLGMQFFSMGLLAEMQTRTYHESQNKATYVIKETVESSCES